jgi:hypothetical protein
LQFLQIQFNLQKLSTHTQAEKIDIESPLWNFGINSLQARARGAGWGGYVIAKSHRSVDQQEFSRLRIALCCHAVQIDP